MWLARYLEHWHGLKEMKHICLHELLGSTSNNSLYKDDNQASLTQDEICAYTQYTNHPANDRCSRITFGNMTYMEMESLVNDMIIIIHVPLKLSANGI